MKRKNNFSVFDCRPLRVFLNEFCEFWVVADPGDHTLLIAKDGTERTIANSAAPIRNARKEITGIVLVFRDTSERRMARRVKRPRSRA